MYVKKSVYGFRKQVSLGATNGLTATTEAFDRDVQPSSAYNVTEMLLPAWPDC